MQKRRLIPAALCALTVVVCLHSVRAEEPQYKLAHRYVFTTVAKKADGSPVCEEHWTFESDGRATVRSGEEIVHSRYRLEDNWLIEDKRETNGKPDCTGHAAGEGEESDDRLYIVPVRSGGFLVCARKPDRVISAANCAARADPEP